MTHANSIAFYKQINSHLNIQIVLVERFYIVKAYEKCSKKQLYCKQGRLKKYIYLKYFYHGI